MENTESEPVLEQYKRFLQDLLGKVIEAMERAAPGPERVRDGLTAYWDASLAQRELRLQVLAAISSASLQQRAQRLAQPFYLIIRSELLGHGLAQPDAAADRIYSGARELARQEAEQGRPDAGARQTFIAGLEMVTKEAAVIR
jgi:hypothetical protein